MFVKFKDCVVNLDKVKRFEIKEETRGDYGFYVIVAHYDNCSYDTVAVCESEDEANLLFDAVTETANWQYNLTKQNAEAAGKFINELQEALK